MNPLIPSRINFLLKKKSLSCTIRVTNQSIENHYLAYLSVFTISTITINKRVMFEMTLFVITSEYKYPFQLEVAVAFISTSFLLLRLFFQLPTSLPDRFINKWVTNAFFSFHFFSLQPNFQDFCFLSIGS